MARFQLNWLLRQPKARIPYGWFQVRAKFQHGYYRLVNSRNILADLQICFASKKSIQQSCNNFLTCSNFLTTLPHYNLWQLYLDYICMLWTIQMQELCRRRPSYCSKAFPKLFVRFWSSCLTNSFSFWKVARHIIKFTIQHSNTLKMNDLLFKQLQNNCKSL